MCETLSKIQQYKHGNGAKLLGYIGQINVVIIYI
jgi:hypothetical protein